MKPAIRVQNLSKLYHIGRLQEGPRTLKAALASNLAEPWRRLQKRFQKQPPRAEGDGNSHANGDDDAEADTIWALKDVSFEVLPGEVIGILGTNGSGKSTLMKVLSRVTAPTSGRVEVRGRVGSLLEVGTGFDPEFTGRENIYLSGPILGMSRKELDKKFDQIVEFADITQFLDTPVKHYSSGMQLRLGFAVAAHLDPEILLVDEALAVGDVAFQDRCLKRMQALAKSGRTILFVSHDTDSIAHLCSRSIILRKGRIQLEGPTPSVVKEYVTGQMGAMEANGTTVPNTGTDAAEEQLHDLLDSPVEEPPIIPLAHEVASTLLTYMPSLLADELAHRLAAPIAGYVAEYLAGALPDLVGTGTLSTDLEDFAEFDESAVDPNEDFDFHLAQPRDLDAPLEAHEETEFQLRNWEHTMSGYPEYLREATKVEKDVNDWLRDHLGWGNCRLICQHTLRPYLTETARVVELGPGTGRWARYLAPRLCKGEYHLIENDPWLVNFLVHYFDGLPHLHVHYLDGSYTLPFAEAGRFDLAFALEIFFGYPLGKIDVFVREFARLLRPGGTCVIQYVDTDEPLVWEFLRKHGTNPPAYSEAFTYHPRAMIRRVFENAGFRVEKFIDLHEVYKGYPFTALVAVREGTAPTPVAEPAASDPGIAPVKESEETRTA